MFKTGNKETDYLIVLLGAALKEESAPAVEGIDMNALLKLADSQQVYSTVLPVLEENGMLSENDLKEWRNYKLSDLHKTIFSDSERANILADFNKQNIDYMLLKGLILRNFYPKISMRQMSDNDILYKEERKKEVYKIMKRNGFHLIGDAAASDDFKKGNCAMDFHRKLFNEKDNYAFNIDLWERAVRKEESSEWLINKEDNYIYSLCHMYKHYITDSCGIRLLCDMYLLSSKEELDREYINKKLAEYDMTDFENLVLSGCKAFFEDEIYDEKTKNFLKKILSVSLFSNNGSIDELVENSGGKFIYMLKRIFPKKQVIIETYTILEKHPILLPYFYLKRLFSRLVYERERIIDEYNAVKKIK